MGDVSWGSRLGWERHEYFVRGSWLDGASHKMVMDPALPGVYRMRGSLSRAYNVNFRGFVDFFNIYVMTTTTTSIIQRLASLVVPSPQRWDLKRLSKRPIQ